MSLVLLFTMGFIIVARTAYLVALFHLDAAPTRDIDRLYEWTLALTIAVWVEIDRRRRSVPAPFEFGAFVFFLWPLLAPWYLFRTRRWAGLACGLASVAFILLLPYATYGLYLAFSA